MTKRLLAVSGLVSACAFVLLTVPLAGQAPAKLVIKRVAENLAILPCNIDLAGGEAELASQPEPQFVLKRAMAEIGDADYDYAIVDSPPQLGFLNVNSLTWVLSSHSPVRSKIAFCNLEIPPSPTPCPSFCCSMT